MKWGRKTGPPYPLQKHSINERKYMDGDKLNEAGKKKYKVNNVKDADYVHKKRVIRNIAIGVGIAAGAAGVALMATKYKKMNKDVIIKGGEALQRLSINKSTELHDNMYVAIGNHDMKRYEALLPKGRPGMLANQKKELLANKDMKIASPKNAERIFQNAKSEMLKELGSKQEGNVLDDGLKAAIKGMDYDTFNRSIWNKNNYHVQAMYSKFKEVAKKAGYSGIIDVNDLKYSGYSANKPTILFDAIDVQLKNISEINVDTAAFNKLFQKELGKV